MLAHARLQLSLVQGATRALHGAEPPRARIARESTRLSAALTLLEEIPCLQTADVGAHAQLVMRRAALVAACVLLMEAEDRRADGGGGRELRRDRPEWQHLERMGAELRRLRRELRELVKQVNVGLVEGSVRAGYRVSRRELEAANERVQAVLGVELRLAEGLKAELEAQQGESFSALSMPAQLLSIIFIWRPTS